jgi:hypothetical protein
MSMASGLHNQEDQGNFVNNNTSRGEDETCDSRDHFMISLHQKTFEKYFEKCQLVVTLIFKT